MIDEELVTKYVQPGRCMCCGSRKLSWSPAQIVEACQQWTTIHGGTPASKDWARSTPEYPSRTTALYVFGTWNDMLRAAGLFGREHGGHNWSKDDIANAMLDHLMAHGRFPGWHQWHFSDPSGKRPSAKTVITHFGSWNAAKKYAGWTGEREPHANAGRVRSTTCSGCDIDLDGYTTGCRPCMNRKWNRADRAKKSAACSPVSQASARADSDSAPGGSPLPIKEAA